METRELEQGMSTNSSCSAEEGGRCTWNAWFVAVIPWHPCGCQSGVLGQELTGTTLAWSKAGLQTNQNQLGHQSWECLVQAQLARLTSRHSRCFVPGISFSKRGLGKALMGGPVSVCGSWECPGHSGILLLLPFLGII